MLTLNDIKAPVALYVDNFHLQFDQILATKSEWLSTAIEHLKQSTGKMVRPILTTLISGLLSGKPSDKTVDSAVLLELIHTATLIHDDVIDEANQRRGRPTLNALFDNRIAVLMGDFVLSSALIGAIATKDLRIISIVSSIGRDLTEGEIRQFETADKVVLSEEVYTDVIRQKTALLFDACARVAAITVEASSEDEERVARFAELIGLAFQIRDDIFDYYSQDVGKPTGNDIREGKITLPLLHCLIEDSQSTPEGKRCIELLNAKTFTPEEIDYLIQFALQRGGIDYAQQRMQQLISEAKELLSVYPDSLYRSSLMALADFIGARTI